MGDHTILATVVSGGGDDNHLPLRLGKATSLLHQCVVIGEEGAELIRAMSKGQEDIGYEARLLLNRDNPLLDISRQVIHVRHGVAADRRCAHFGFPLWVQNGTSSSMHSA